MSALLAPTTKPLGSLSCKTPGALVIPARSRCRRFGAMRADGPVSSLQEHSVVTVGEALFDCLADQLGKPKELVESWTPYPGGAPANVATALARLGVHAVFLGALGRDQLGEQFMALLAERRVDTSATQRNDHPTRDVLVVRSADGDREFAGFGTAASSEYADCFLDPEAVPEAVIAAADVLVTGTLALARPVSAAAVRKAVHAAKGGGHCTVVVDVNWRPVFWDDKNAARQTVLDFVTAGADILKVSDEEAEWLFGIPAAAVLQHPERVLAAVRGARGVLVSAGEKGSSYAFRAPGGKMDLIGEVPVMDVRVVDTTGAGDCFLAGFICYMLLSGGLDALVADPAKLQRATQWATACGAAICQRPGAIEGQPTVREVEQLLQAAGWNV